MALLSTSLTDAIERFGPTESPLFVTDLDGQVVFWNEGGERMFGLKSRDAVARSCYQVVKGMELNGDIHCRADCPALRAAEGNRSLPDTDLLFPVGRPSVAVRARVQHIVLRDYWGLPVGLLHLLDETGPAPGRRE
ncbi:MAG: PAS domain-containing protein [Candidatus Dormibacteria bacterium]